MFRIWDRKQSGNEPFMTGQKVMVHKPPFGGLGNWLAAKVIIVSTPKKVIVRYTYQGVEEILNKPDEILSLSSYSTMRADEKKRKKKNDAKWEAKWKKGEIEAENRLEEELNKLVNTLQGALVKGGRDKLKKRIMQLARKDYEEDHRYSRSSSPYGIFHTCWCRTTPKPGEY